MTRKALLIGINYSGSKYALSGCINDSLNIKRFLMEEFKLDEKDITLMTEVAGTSSDLWPSRSNILKQMKALVTGAKSGDKLFFSYSGHGTQRRDSNGDENDGFDECICPVSTKSEIDELIVDDEIRQVLVDSLPKGAHLFMMYDSCHSGSVADLRHNYRFSNRHGKDSYQMDIEKGEKETKADVILISGCLDNQTSADAYIPENNRSEGAMTYTFLKTYRELKVQKKSITLLRLLRDMNIHLKDSHYTQTPQLSSGKLINLDSKVEIL